MDLFIGQSILPFWTTYFILMQLIMRLQYAVILTAVGAGLVEYFKAQSSEHSTVNAFMSGLQKIGHRGCTNAPENTLEAVREAHRLGIKAVEFDVMISADGEPYIFHDSTCERTTNGTGNIGEMQWADIKQLDAAYHHEGYDNVKVPHLREMLTECKKLGLKVFLDVKGSQPIAMANVIADMAEQFKDLHLWASVCSFYPQTLYAVKWKTPQFITILTHRPWVLSIKHPNGPPRNNIMWKRWLAPPADVLLEKAINNFLWYFCGVSGVLREQSVISIDEVDYWRKRDLQVIVWTVNDVHRKQYLESQNIPYLTDDCSV